MEKNSDAYVLQHKYKGKPSFGRNVKYGPEGIKEST